MTNDPARRSAAIISAAAWCGLIIQFVVAEERTDSTAAALWRLSGYFTILTNLTVAILFLSVAAGRRQLRHPLLFAGLALCMALVGIVYEVMLRHVLKPQGWQVVADLMLHDFGPVFVVAFWFAFVPKGQLRPSAPWLIALYPVAYLGYALVRGAATGTYAYPFIDVDEIGWAMTAINSAVIAFFFLLAGHGMWWLDRRMGRLSAPMERNAPSRGMDPGSSPG